MKGSNFIVPTFFCLTLAFSESRLANDSHLNLIKNPLYKGNNLMYQIPLCDKLPTEEIRKGTTISPQFKRYSKIQKPAVAGLWDGDVQIE